MPFYLEVVKLNEFSVYKLKKTKYNNFIFVLVLFFVPQIFENLPPN